MKLGVLVLVAVVLFSSLAAADSGLNVEVVDKSNVVIAELGNPATYDLIIDNTGMDENFRIFTLVGVALEPELYVELPHGKTTVPVVAHMSDKILRERQGLLYFEYQIKGVNRDLFKDDLFVKIVPLKDAIGFDYYPLHPDESETTIEVTNKEDVEVNNLTVVFSSVFFRESYTFDLKPNEVRTFPVSVQKDENLVAGPYIVTAEVVTKDGTEKIEGVVDYLEKEGTSVEQGAEGILVRENFVKKTNRGNVPVMAEASLKKNIFSRLFTTSSPEPASVKREGAFVEYSWKDNLMPGETLEAKLTTNYTFPFFIILIIIVVGFVVRNYYLTAVVVRKNVSLVRTRGGEFALRVVLRVKARKAVDKVQLSDSLPVMAKLFENFGKKPDRVDHSSRRLFWDVGSLARGSERVYSYVIYSKLNVVGRFELPTANVHYELDGKKGVAYSNRAFFAMEKS